MANESLNLPVRDFLGKLKVYMTGFLTPVILGAVYFFSAPLLLISTNEWKKTDALLVEIWSVAGIKQLQAAADLFKKKRVEKVFLLFDDSYALEPIVGLDENYINESKATLGRLGVPEDKIEIIKIPVSKNPGTMNNAANVAKILLSQNMKSLLIQTEEYHSKRSLLTYKKVLSPLGIEVYVYPQKSRFSSTNWFMSEEGLEHVVKQLLKHTYYTIRGYY